MPDPERKLRILVVDDSVAIRRILLELLSSESSFEMLTAPSGRVALSKIHDQKPDLVTLDIEMPEMNGLETLRRIRAQYPQLPVIMVSSQTEKGAAVTLDALALGANDYVAKPSQAGDRRQAMNAMQRELIDKIKAQCIAGFTAQPPAPSIKKVAPSLQVNLRGSGNRLVTRSSLPPQAVVIAVSTGGPNALMQLLPRIPADFPLPILIVQHMPSTFTKLFATRLNAVCALPVIEAASGMVIAPGSIWLAPGDYHLSLRRDGEQVRVELNQEAAENSCRPAADVLFRAALEVYGGNLLALVMTGMGSDGLKGCDLIKAAGGQVIVQDETSSVVWGMPGAVYKAGLADAVFPLAQLAPALIQGAQGRAFGPERIPDQNPAGSRRLTPKLSGHGNH